MTSSKDQKNKGTSRAWTDASSQGRVDGLFSVKDVASKGASCNLRQGDQGHLAFQVDRPSLAPLTCMSLLAIKPLPSASQVWKNSCAFLSMVTSVSTISCVSIHSRLSRGPRQVPFPFGPWAGLRGLEPTFWSEVAIQVCQFLQVFSDPENRR